MSDLTWHMREDCAADATGKAEFTPTQASG